MARVEQHTALLANFPEEVIILILTFCNALDIVSTGAVRAASQYFFCFRYLQEKT